MISEELFALADELESFEGYTCERCAAYEQPECGVYLPCTEIVSKYCARRIREAVERDGEGATTVSAYDLLSEDEREAIAWVREHGGLGAVEKRLMPEGMEWPKVDGKPVDFKTVYGPSLGVLDAVSIYNNMACEVMGHDGTIKPASEIHAVVLAADGKPLEVGQAVYAPHYDYVKCTVLAIEWVVDGYLVEVENEGGHKFRQTPDEFTHQRPVLDADGEPIKEGDTVYLLPGEWCGRFPCLWFYGGEELKVIDLNPKYGDIGSIKCCKAGNMTRLCYPKPSQLTHDRPVLDADGVPCREGDEVWEARSHRRREIVGTHYRDYRTGEPLILCDGDDAIPIPATCVTHTNPEQPDTYAKLYEDVHDERCGSEEFVRRCRALAESGE